MSASILGQIPEPNAAAPIAADDFTLVWVDDHVIDRRSVVVAPLNHAGARIPNFDGAVLGTRDHPLPIAVECNTGYIARMALEYRGGRGIRRANVE